MNLLHKIALTGMYRNRPQCTSHSFSSFLLPADFLNINLLHILRKRVFIEQDMVITKLRVSSLPSWLSGIKG